MGNAWTVAQELAEKHASQGGIFVRLAKDGDKIVGAFVGEPYAREVVWTGERYETFDEEKHAGKRASLRVMLNFFVPADSAMKVIEGGTRWFKDVLKVRDKYGLEKWLFEIERHGDSGDPKTTYSILPEEKLDADMRARIAACKPNDLEALASGEGNTDGKPKDAADGGGLIDPRLAGDLVARLKALPRSEVDVFLNTFGVQRVRDLKDDDAIAARELLIELESKQQAEQQPEVDPFG